MEAKLALSKLIESVEAERQRQQQQQQRILAATLHPGMLAGTSVFRKAGGRTDQLGACRRAVFARALPHLNGLPRGTLPPWADCVGERGCG